MKLLFDQPLIKGLIKNRPNRFIMDVDIDDMMHKSHCPVTGKIGNIVFKDIPCLLSFSDNPNRKTQYTVEAISIDDSKSWIGINQTKMNSIVNFMLQTNQLNSIFNNIETIKREVKFKDSKLDFQIDNKHYLEVKTLLRDFGVSSDTTVTDTPKGIFYERLVRHLNDLSENITPGTRAIMLLCFTYDAPKFTPPNGLDYSNKINLAAMQAKQKGVEQWQANFKFDEYGVELIKHFNL